MKRADFDREFYATQTQLDFEGHHFAIWDGDDGYVTSAVCNPCWNIPGGFTIWKCYQVDWRGAGKYLYGRIILNGKVIKEKDE